MGEYATRISDGVEVKLGVCNEMFYLRYSDRHAVKGKEAPGDDLGRLYRLPYPDEDGIKPGDYKDCTRGLRLCKPSAYGVSDFQNEALAEHPGTIQLTHESGLLVNVKCFHGEKLPSLGDGATAFWNGKSHSYELIYLKTTEQGIKPVIQCRHCRTMWCVEWTDIWGFIPNFMQDRLTRYSGLPLTKAAA